MLEIIAGGGGYRSSAIISDINLSISAGSVTALLGRNGVGKSTLMRFIAGVLPVSAGAVRFRGDDMPKSPVARSRSGLAYVPQGRHIFPRLTVIENIQVAAYARGFDGNESVAQAFERFPALKARAHVMGGRLSGGQQQILALARALAARPTMILLDEPTEGIQPSIIMEIQDILLAMHQETGITIFFAEQNLDFALGLAQDCFLMDRGTIIKKMPLQDLASDPDLIHQVLGV